MLFDVVWCCLLLLFVVVLLLLLCHQREEGGGGGGRRRVRRRSGRCRNKNETPQHNVGKKHHVFSGATYLVAPVGCRIDRKGQSNI